MERTLDGASDASEQQRKEEGGGGKSIDPLRPKECFVSLLTTLFLFRNRSANRRAKLVEVEEQNRAQRRASSVYLFRVKNAGVSSQRRVVVKSPVSRDRVGNRAVGSGDEGDEFVRKKVSRNSAEGIDERVSGGGDQADGRVGLKVGDGRKRGGRSEVGSERRWEWMGREKWKSRS